MKPRRLPRYWPPPETTGSREMVAAIWAAFWLLVLTAGEPDLLGAVVRWVERLGT